MLRPLLLLGTLACTAACREGSDGPAANILDDADLVSLELSAGALSPAFDPDTTDYSMDVGSGIDSTMITATTSDAGATIRIRAMPATSGVPFGPVSLTLGTSSIAVVVTSEDQNTVKVYRTGVTRTPFNLTLISVLDDDVWPINREMVFGFNEDVDFSSVSSNTIRIRSKGNVPAVGTFHLRDARTVVFQPSCPTREDLSDAGLQPGTVEYEIVFAGTDSGATNTVRSVSGGLLQVTQARNFFTEDLASPFLDLGVGPPRPVVRAQGSAEEDATYLEVGGDSGERVYFERGLGPELFLSVPGFVSPLNLYSEPRERVAVVIAFDQPIGLSSVNLSPSRLHLEFLDAASTWRPLETRVTLLANCAGTGAKVRLEPVAILPQASRIRAVVLPGFEDLAGDMHSEPVRDFAEVPTATVEHGTLAPPDLEGDELLEGFDLGAGSPATLLDTAAELDAAPAEWGAGRLSASAFEGTGGPNGDFDWVVRNGENFFFDTTSQPINGGPGGVPTTTLLALGGLVDLRNFTVEEGGTVRVQGPNPLQINATGDVRIRGRLDLSGFNGHDVLQLNFGNIVESGGAGAAGGGRGGNANDNTIGPTPRGGRGQGPFAQAGLGGEGGEMGFSSSFNKNARRPGGGGGGRFTRDWIGSTTFTDLSLAAEPGSDGSPSSKGAESGLSPARGGAPGQGPFLDADADNDFFGLEPVVTNGEITGFIHGELVRPWAGHGGGGGGNAGRAFPNPNWSFASDEKGGPGGGGGGGLVVKALGRIVFGRAGQIVANGGRGGQGENVTFLDHVGGTGGGGSGGHVILESATAVDFTDLGANVNGALRDFVLAAGPLRKVGPTQDVDTCAQSLFCCPSGCTVFSNGGAGGDGLVQIHVPDPTRPPDSVPTAQIVVPAAALAAADVLDQVTSPPACVLMPTLARRSLARSKWISIGKADLAPGGLSDPVRFLFGGLETAGADEGKIRTSGSHVPEQAPLVEVDLEGSADVAILPDGVTFAFRGAALEPLRSGTTSGISNDLYLRAPALLREFVLRIDSGSTAGDFVVADASYADVPGEEELRVTVAVGEAGTPRSFIDQRAGEPGVLSCKLIPRFFRVVTDGTEDLLPATSYVRILFQAAREDGSGGVDEANPLVDWTADLARFNALAPGLLQFFRFQVEFQLDDTGSLPPEAIEAVSLDFLRLPFVF